MRHFLSSFSLEKFINSFRTHSMMFFTLPLKGPSVYSPSFCSFSSVTILPILSVTSLITSVSSSSKESDFLGVCQLLSTLCYFAYCLPF